MRLVRTGAMGVRKMRSLRKQKKDLEKKMEKKRALKVLVQILSVDDEQLEFTDPELIFAPEELLLDPTHDGQILGAEEEIDNLMAFGDGSLNNPSSIDDAHLEKREEEEESVQIFLACFDEWVDNHDPIDDDVTI